MSEMGADWGLMGRRRENPLAAVNVSHASHEEEARRRMMMGGETSVEHVVRDLTN